jgi:zinc protease
MANLRNVGVQALLSCMLAAAMIGPAHAVLPIEHWQQPSGAAVYLVSSMAIPMVDVQIDFDGGSRRDPAKQAGLANAMASAVPLGLRAAPAAGGGGDPAAALDENALSDAWADLGASFGGGASADRLSFSLRSLTYADVLQQAAALAAREIAEPAFPERLWAREREKRVAALKEAHTRPAVLASQAYAGAVYGTHPYGYVETEATLKAIQAADLRAHHARYVRACNAHVSVVGALDRAHADALVAQILGRLPTTDCPTLPRLAEVAALQGAQDIRIPFAAAQAQVLLGQPGVARASPDYFALLVGNHILGGGGFTSRLTAEVREKRGLSYSVSSGFAPGLHAGAFTISLQTRPDQADAALAVARDVLRGFIADGPTEDELQAAKAFLIGGFPLRLDSNRKLLDNVANIAWNQLPLDYLDTWTAQIERLNVTDIRTAMARALQPERMVTVVLAPASNGSALR